MELECHELYHLISSSDFSMYKLEMFLSAFHPLELKSNDLLEPFSRLKSEHFYINTTNELALELCMEFLTEYRNIYGDTFRPIVSDRDQSLDREPEQCPSQSIINEPYRLTSRSPGHSSVSVSPPINDPISDQNNCVIS